MKQNKMHYAWLIFVGCCVISFTGFGLIVNTQGLFFTPVAEELNISRAQISMVLTIQNIVQMMVLPFAGNIFTKYRTRNVLTASFLVLAIAIMSAATYQNVYSFYVMGAIIGLVQPFCITLVLPILLGNWFDKKLGFALGFASALSGIGGTIANPIVSGIITNFGWRSGYLFIGLIALILVLPFTLFVMVLKPSEKGLQAYGSEETMNHEASFNTLQEVSGYTIKEAYRSHKFYLFCLAAMSLNMIAGFVQHVSSHVVNSGFTLNVGATVMSGIMFGAAAGKFIAGLLLDKWPSNTVTVIYGLIGILGWFGLNFSTNSQLFVLSGFTAGFAQALLLVAVPFMVKKVFGMKSYSSIYATIGALGSLMSAISAYLGGVVFDVTESYSFSINLNVGFYIIAIISILIALITVKNKATVKESEVAIN